MNDSHGYLEKHPEYYWVDGKEIYREAGGYATISQYFKQARNENPGGVIALDNGDTIHGTFAAVNNQGRDMVKILNELNFDAWTAHWEFAYGPDNLKNISEKLNYPLLAINCYNEKNKNLAYKPYRVVEKRGIRFGLVGIASNIVDKTMPDSFSKDHYFTLGKEELPGYINKLKQDESADIVIVFSHLGYPQELKLAKETDGIDILLSGHTHNRIYKPVIVNETVLIQSGCHGSFLGRLDIQIENGSITNWDHKLVSMDRSIGQDPVVKDMIDEILSPHRSMLNELVGETVKPLTRNRVIESTMDNLLLKSLLEETGADIAFSNGWRYGAPIPPGDITINDLWNIVPVNPPVSVCEITGKEIKKMLEEDMENTFSADPYNQMGGFLKRCKGIYIYFKIENPPGKRIQEFYIGGKKVEMNKSYKATFVTSQGIPKKFGDNRTNLDIKAIGALRKYTKRKKTLSIGFDDNIVPI